MSRYEFRVNPCKKLFKPFTLLFLALSSLCASAENIPVNYVAQNLSIGNSSQANTRGSVVTGKDSLTVGSYSNALSNETSLLGNGSVVINDLAQSSDEESSDGNSTKETESGIVALADETLVNYDPDKKNLSIGPEAKIPEKTTTPDGSVDDTANAVAIGSENTTAVLNSVAIGKQARAEAQGTIAIGNDARARGAYSLAFGKESRANGDSAIAIGKEAWALKLETVALGAGARSTEDKAVAIGQGAHGFGLQSVAVGTSSQALGDNSVAVGPSAQAIDADSVAFGSSSKAEGVEATALGPSSLAKGRESLAVGNGAKAYYDSDSAVGHDAVANGGSAAAFGYQAHAVASKAIAIGNAANATEENATAIGAGSNSTAEEAMALGTKAFATAESAIAIGTEANTPAESSIVIGQKAEATENAVSGVALGQNSSVTIKEGVALGANSIANTDKGAFGYDPRTGKQYEMPEGVKDDPVWQSTAAAVSVGGEGEEGQITRQITNLAAGTNDTDAVNVAQLKAAQHHYYSVKSEIQGEGSNYLNDGATGENALAAGVGASANGDRGISVGLYSNAAGANSIAIGSASELEVAENEDGTQTITGTGSPVASGNNAIAIGTNVQATAANATAVGYGTLATGTGSSAYGLSAKATATNSTALGANAVATFESGTAVGSSAKVDSGASFGTALGYNSIVEGGANHSSAIGGSKVTDSATYSLAAGTNAVVGGGSSYSVVIGSSSDNSDSYRSRAYSSSYSTVVGSGAQATYGSQYSTVLGYQSKTTNSSRYGTVVGSLALADGGSEYGTAVGSQAKVYSSSYGTAVGFQAETSSGSRYSTAIGYQAITTNSGEYATAVGYQAKVTSGSRYGTAIGSSSIVQNSAYYGTAIGGSEVTEGSNYSVGIGKYSIAQSSSEYSVVIGGSSSSDYSNRTRAYSSDYASVIGTGAQAYSADYGTVVGYKSEVSYGATRSTAIGYSSKATSGSTNSTVIGYESIATSGVYNGTAIGYQSTVSSGAHNGTAIGYQSTVTNSALNSTVIGFQSIATNSAQNSTVLGYHATATNSSIDGTVIGYQSKVTNRANYSTAIGGAEISGYEDGDTSYTTVENNIAIGRNSKIQNHSDNSIVIGSTTETTDTDRTRASNSDFASVIGSGSRSLSANYGTLVGYQSEISNGANNTTVIGYQSLATNGSVESTVVGYQSQASNGALGATVIGYQSLAENGSIDNTVIGYQSLATNSAKYGTVVGYNSELSGSVENATAVGFQAKVMNSSNYGTALGNLSTVTNGSQYATAIGGATVTNGSLYAIAMGEGAIASNAPQAIVMGQGASATKEDTIVLGSYSKSGAEKGILGYDPLDPEHLDPKWEELSQSPIWSATNNAVSFGRAAEYDEEGNETVSAITRQINNVAAGTLDTDAVNVAQLKQVTADLKLNFSAEDFVAPIENEDGTFTPSQNVVAKTSGGRLPIIGDGEIVEEEQIGEDGNSIKTKNRLDGNIITRVAEDVDGTQAIQISMADNLNLGGPGKDGAPGVDGSIGINGKDGVGNVTIKVENQEGSIGVSGSDGKEGVIIQTEKDTGGHIVIYGKDGAPGEDGQPGTGPAANITVVQSNAERGTNGLDGKDGITRIEFVDPKDPDNPRHVATLEDDGMNYAGNFDTTASVKLNREAQVTGIVSNLEAAWNKTLGEIREANQDKTEEERKAAEDAGFNNFVEENLVDGNIAVIAKQAGKEGKDAQLVIKMNKNLTLPDGSLRIVADKDNPDDPTKNIIIQNETFNDDHSSQNGGTSFGGNQIHNVASGVTGELWTTNLKDADGNDVIGDDGNVIQIPDDRKNNVANIGDLEAVSAAHTVVTVGEQHAVLNEEGTKGTVDGGNLHLVQTIENGQSTYDLSLADNITLGGKDGKDGSIGVAGADGKDGVSIEVQNGGGHIVIKGEDGKDGTAGVPGPKADITIVQGPAGVNGKDGETLTRIEYVDPDDPNKTQHQVATLDDGMKYAGNFDADGNINDKGIPVKLNNQVNIVGDLSGLKDEEKDVNNFVDGNIAVVAKEEGENAQLVIKMNKDINLKDGSLTIEGSDPDNHPENNITIAQGNVSMGGNQIKNVASGDTGILWDDSVEGQENWNNAANIGDLNQLKQTVTGAHTAVTVNGGEQAGVNEYFGTGNLKLMVTTDPETEQKTYDLKLADNLTLGGPGLDGKDGIDGSIGVAGADGKDGVSIEVQNGGGHIVIKGEDGKDGTAGVPGPKADITVVQGPAGVNGIDGQNGMTRIQYIDSDGQPHDVATLDDGLTYEGNFGNATVRLNKLTEIVGGTTHPLEEADRDNFVDNNLAVFAEQDGDNAKLVLRMNKDLNLPDGSITITDNSHAPIVIKQGGVSFGGNVIHNVAPGEDPTDAVNLSQLQNYVTENGTVEHAFYADTVLNPDLGSKGAVLSNKDHLNIVSNDKYLTTYVDPASNTIKIGFNADQLDSLPAATGMHYFAYDDSKKELYNYHNEGAIGANSMAIGPNARADVEQGVAVGYGSISNVKTDQVGYHLESAGDDAGFIGTTVIPDAKDPTWVATAGAFSVGASGEGVNSIITRQITNVAAGLQLTDAVNVAQLKLLKEYVDSKVDGSAGGGSIGGDAGMNYGADNIDGDVLLAADKQQKLAILGDNNNISTEIKSESNGASIKVKLNENIKVNTVNVGDNVHIDQHGFTIGASGPNQIQITEGNISMGGNQIHNVAPGTAGTDAVNVNQLNASNRQIFNKINDVDKNARAGIAQAIATAGLPQAYLPGKSMMAAAAGGYDGQAGIAIGFSSISDDGKWVFKGSASGNSQGKFGGSLGLGYLF